MSLWTSIKDSAVQKRLKDEAYYTQAANEISRGVKRDGLWAKAIALSGGDEALVKAKYISLLVDTLRDEAYIVQQAVLQTTSTPRHLVNAEVEVDKRRPLWRRAGRKILNGFLTLGLWLWVGTMVFGGIMWLIDTAK